MIARPFAIPAPLTAALLSACAYFACGALYAERGEPNADEGFYAYASYAVMHGRVPYRDFAYTQTPLLPYIQGAVFSAVGYGVRQERWLNVAWGTLAVALAALLWSCASVPNAWRVLLVLSWCLCKPLVFLSTSGKTYGIVGLLMIGASACVYLRQTPWARAPEGRLRPYLLLCALSALCVLSVGCRLTAAPSAVLLWAGFAVLDRGGISKALLLAIPVLFSLALIGPFYALDPRNAVYWTWTYHHLNMVSELSHPSRIGLLVESCRVAPAPAAFGLAGIALVGRALFRALRQGAGGAPRRTPPFRPADGFWPPARSGGSCRSSCPGSMPNTRHRPCRSSSLASGFSFRERRRRLFPSGTASGPGWRSFCRSAQGPSSSDTASPTATIGWRPAILTRSIGPPGS